MKSLTIAAFSLMTATAAIAQTAPAPGTTPRPPSATAPADRMAAPAMQPGENLTLTDEQAKNWVSKTIYSSDNKNLGSVAAFARDASGKVSEMHADIGGFLGIGETRVRVMPNQFHLDGDRVVLSVTSEQVKALPKIAK